MNKSWKNWDTVAQVMIFVLGTASVILVAFNNKWGFAIALINQPFWFITSIKNKQWGVLAVSFIYTISWAIGFYNWFFVYNK